MNTSEGRLAQSSDVSFVPLAFEQTLSELNANDVRYSRGFLAADPSSYFNGLVEHWVPFFMGLGLEVQVNAINKVLYFPQDLSRIVVVEISGESAVIGIDDLSQDVIAQAFAPGSDAAAAEVLIEYLERRFLTTITKTWNGREPLICQYLSSDWADEVEVIGAVELELLIGGQKAVVWFGLGPRLLEELEISWRARVAERLGLKDTANFDDTVHLLTLDLSFLSVPPALLIDYLRAGTIVDLELPVPDTVTLSRNGEPWARGVLRQFNGMFAVEIIDTKPEPFQPVEGMTRVAVELARTELDERSLQEYAQRGAVLPTAKQVGSIASIVINGENVGSALVGEVDGRLSLSILGK
ncbi:MAG: FliM/FliN family flagellar motor C-terminal domain-containing protein [Bdellovibrionota bacterium]